MPSLKLRPVRSYFPHLSQHAFVAELVRALCYTIVIPRLRVQIRSYARMHRAALHCCAQTESLPDPCGKIAFQNDY